MTRHLVVAAFFIAASALTSLSAQAPAAPVADSIAGVHVGATLEEVRSRLAPLGTVVGRDARDGGRRDVWTLASGDFASVAVTTNGRGRVVWVTGFLRPGHEKPFSAFGDLQQAAGRSDVRAVWESRNAHGGYRLSVRGAEGRAKVITLLKVGRLEG